MPLTSQLVSWMPPRLFVPFMALQYRFFEPELGRIGEFVPDDRDAVDVGVWWGPWSWWLAKRVPRVHSFEPNPHLIAGLRGALPSNVLLHQVALGDRQGESELWIPVGGRGTEGRATIEPTRRTESGGRLLPVVTGRLDEFDLGNVGFVKIDVEGHELAVLQGATELLAAQRPTLMIEIEDRTDDDRQFDQILEFLSAYSYRGSYLHHRCWHPMAEFDRHRAKEMNAKVSQNGYATNFLLYSRRHIHNFLFMPE